MADPLALVRTTCQQVASQASHVSFNQQAVESLAASLTADDLANMTAPNHFDRALHFCDGTALTAQYLLVVDVLNFCFWPDPHLEYEHLAGGLKRALEEDKGALDAERLAELDGEGLRQLLQWPHRLPLQDERARLLREVGQGLLEHYEGQAAKLVKAADHSAAQLVSLVTAAFPGFRDHCVYRGRQVFLYKRAQIFVGDVWGAFRGKGLGRFTDIGQLTMFADYRVPVVLRELGILHYANRLARSIESKNELVAGCEEEVEIRAYTVIAVERLRKALQDRLVLSDDGGGDGKRRQAAPNSVQLDWWLWERGEREREVAPHEHHRVLTVYY